MLSWTVSNKVQAVTLLLKNLKKRLVSALTIAMVVDEFHLPLSAKQWTGLLEGLRFPMMDKSASNSLMKRINETFNPEYKYVKLRTVRTIQYIPVCLKR